ncbi:DUF6685 family protein [Stutzerimonas decontaminans]|uniref:DUF6685 family protein n=1 Tax=Stutzerimonas decontaminans TaxID=3022791 RepID=UPI001CA57C30|nr:DUF6685 family protein [Stutzerimonas decontaminans]MCQ4245115.1 hypothetical protein [Stutzerimonas decontaminans]
MWKKAAKFVIDSVREDLGYPSSLVNLIAKEPRLNMPLVERDKGISSCEVVKWNEFGGLSSGRGSYGRRRLTGWGYSPGSHRNYGAIDLYREDLLDLGKTWETPDWICDIQDVDGFSASKSDLRRFKSMDAMVEHSSKEMISEITPEKLAENLAWDEIRIISRVDHDYFQTWSWDGRVFLMNSGGSHHFAAAKYIAARLGVKVPLKGKCRAHSLNQVALASLTRDFDIFVMSSHYKYQMEFHRAMQSFRATYYLKDLPRPYSEQCAIFLPKSEKRSANVAQVLKDARFQDLGWYLKNLSSLPLRSIDHV